MRVGQNNVIDEYLSCKWKLLDKSGYEIKINVEAAALKVPKISGRNGPGKDKEEEARGIKMRFKGKMITMKGKDPGNWTVKYDLSRTVKQKDNGGRWETKRKKKNNWNVRGMIFLKEHE